MTGNVACVEAVLDETAEWRVLWCQRQESPSYVAWRRDAECRSEPTGGAAVIGNGHHSGDHLGVVEDGGERLREPVPTADGDDVQPLVVEIQLLEQRLDEEVVVGHRGSRSRCRTDTSYPSRSTFPAIASASATDRCLPPVHPMPIVR